MGVWRKSRICADWVTLLKAKPSHLLCTHHALNQHCPASSSPWSRDPGWPGFPGASPCGLPAPASASPHNCCPMRVLPLTHVTLQPCPHSLQAPCMASCVVGVPSTTLFSQIYLFGCARSLVAALELLVGSSPLTGDHTLVPCTGSSES